jgi:hypothetical protein
MAAAYLGKHDRSSARAVLVRTLQISSALGLGLGLLLAACSHQVVGLFTKDAAVAALACAIMPVIAVCMPLDAAASITDGGLIAAGQTNALSVIQVLGTLVQYGVMAVLINMGLDSVVYVWGVLKVMTLARLGGGLYIHFGSKRSAYKPKHAAAASATATGAAAAEAAEDVSGVPAGASTSSSTSSSQPDSQSSSQPDGSSAVSSDGSSTQQHSSNGHHIPSVLTGGPSLPAQQPVAQPLQQPGQAPRSIDWVVGPQQHTVIMQQRQQQQQQQQPAHQQGGMSVRASVDSS